MSLSNKKAYCSQCYFPVRWRCPICLLTKIPRQCRAHKTPASLYWHLKQEHLGFVGPKFSFDEVIGVINSVVKAIEWGLFADF